MHTPVQLFQWRAKRALNVKSIALPAFSTHVLYFRKRADFQAIFAEWPVMFENLIAEGDW